ncbi:MAG: RnfABCDGE type electron transport complex subunit B [Treponema sp.]|nr:RnfABCDGE type electron transport complex subunit B [Treponema sp.]
MIIIITLLFAFILAFVLGTALGFFKKFFAVEEDSLAVQVREALPGANCGACGFPGCDAYAAAIASRQTGISGCSVGGKTTAEKLSAIMGISANVVSTVSFVACRGTPGKAGQKGIYTGTESCRAAKISAGGTKLCAWGCLGFGDCVKVCKFGAIRMGEDRIPVIDHSKCTGCKLCTNECPQSCIRNIPRDSKGAVPVCNNRNTIKAQVRKTCTAGCIKCEICVKNCPEHCIEMQNGIPVVDYGKCTSCGTCVEKCPVKVLKILERDVIGTLTSQAPIKAR